MKNLKTSFGVAAFVIAVSGALATKATTQMQTRYVQEDDEICTAVSSSALCSTGGTGCLHAGQQLFQNRSIDEKTCLNSLRTP